MVIVRGLRELDGRRIRFDAGSYNLGAGFGERSRAGAGCGRRAGMMIKFSVAVSGHEDERTYSLKRNSTPFVTVLFYCVEGLHYYVPLVRVNLSTGASDNLLNSGKLHNPWTPTANCQSLNRHI